MDVRDWFTANISIITDVSTAVFGVEIATQEATRIATEEQSLTSPAARTGFDQIVTEARACRAVVDRALSLPPIPDADSDAQFRHTMELQGKWADTIAQAAADVDPAGLDRASKLQIEVARQGALITEAVRKVWPDYDPNQKEA